MLITKIFVNSEKIDEIQVLNTGKKVKGEAQYKILTHNVPFFIYHRREEGWIPLMQKVLKAIDENCETLLEEDIRKCARTVLEQS